MRKLPFGLRGTRIGFDTEATGLNGYGAFRRVTYNFGNAKAPIIVQRKVVPARPFCYTFCDDEGNTAYVRGQVDPKTRAVTWDKREHAGVRQLLEDPSLIKIGHNPRYDLNMARFDGIQVRGRVIDTMIVAHTYTAGAELTYALKPLAKKYLQISELDETVLKKATHAARLQAKRMRWSYAVEELGGKDPAKADYWMAPDALCRDYAVQDAVRSMLFYQMWMPEIEKDARMLSVFKREHEVFWVLKRMEDRGTRVHPVPIKKLQVFYEDYKAQQAKVAEKEIGNRTTNYNSTPQMAKIFYDTRMHVPNVTTERDGSPKLDKKTGKPRYSLTGEHLLKMAEGYVVQRTDFPPHLLSKRRTYGYELTEDKKAFRRGPDPLAKAILEYKAAHQTITSFLNVYERNWVKESEGVYVLHPNYRQTGTVTGRLSCSDPNLMQVASETTGRRKASIQSRPREGFGPRPGHLWYLPDYSQIEVWLFAFLSKEERMIVSLMSGKDFHGDIAKKVFGRRADFETSKDYYRKCAKLIMFCKLYGGGAKKVALLLKSSIEEAVKFIEEYEAELPGVKRFMKKMIKIAEAEGVIYNVFGRRYEFDHDFAYKSTNYIIQGTAAEVMKNALVNVDRRLRTHWNDEPRLLLTIHDEIIVEVPEALHSMALMRDIIAGMQEDQQTLGLPVPLPVEMKIVRPHQFWHQATKVKVLKRIAA